MSIRVLLLAAIVFSTRTVMAAEPIKALYITGGGYHDYKKIAETLTTGIARHANVAFTPAWGVETLKDPKLGEGFDVIVYNLCFADEKNPELIDNAIRVTREGKPTVLVHCAMHCFMASDAWTACCGLRTRKHDGFRGFGTTKADPQHPVVKAFPDKWSTGGDELYQNIEFGADSHALLNAFSSESKKDHVVAWVQQFGKGRVFATTLGHDMQTVGQDAYHLLLANGILWAVGKLADDGKPTEGAGPVATAADWSEQQVAELPAGEKPIHLFNGKDLSGWKGHTDKYFSVNDGVIVAKNDKDNAPKVSTYLLTDKNYRDFRLIFEAKLVESEMHSGIAMWGKQHDPGGEPISYQGHLVMFPSGWGFYDLYRRNSIYTDDGRAKKAGKQHEWNQMEILAIGDRIRHAVNGELIADWRDPKPELCQSGPIGLQLHSNTVPQEIQFRGLILTEDPKDEMATVKK